MADTLSTDTEQAVKDLSALIADHKGIDVTAMDLRGLNSWTDFFIIATVSSSAHLKGLQKYIKDFALEHDIEILRRHRKVASDDEWNLIDMGSIVVHLMTEKARSFYELERLWSEAKTVVL